MNEKKVEDRDTSVEDFKDGASLASDTILLANDIRESAEKKLVRKLDTRLLPTVIAIYIMNYIDRNAVSSARLKGLEQDLHLTEIRYSAVLAILFAAYCPSQIPSTMILNRITRPSIYIGTCTILWGLTSALAGVTHNYPGILACRFFIGLPEAAFYPGTVYLLSRWYTRKELALRSCALYAGNIISNAFGSLMAAGILSGMEGKMGIRAWRWLFYIEGAITIFVGLQASWLLPDHPYNTRWLSPAERRLARVRLAEDAGEADEDFSTESAWEGLKLALKDPKVPIFALMSFSQLLGLGYVNFFPTLTATLGFSTTTSLLLAAPPWVFTALICVVNARHADSTGERYIHISIWWWVTILGYIIALSTMSVGGRYVSLFLMATGHAGFAMTLVWVSNSIPRPPTKRAASIGVVNGIGNIGNLVSSFVWKVEWAPQYHPSMVIGICSLLVSIAMASVMRIMLTRENKRLEHDEKGNFNRERVQKAAQLEAVTLDEAIERKRGFRYLS